jgi:hypothetical protein
MCAKASGTSPEFLPDRREGPVIDITQRKHQLVTKESNSTHNGKNIYREGAKNAKDVKNGGDFTLIQDLQDSLYVLCDFARAAFYFFPFGSSLSGLGL